MKNMKLMRRQIEVRDMNEAHRRAAPIPDVDRGGSWARRSCKYFNVCGDRFNCRDCAGYDRRIIVIVEGGVIQDVHFPDHPAFNTLIEVHDYDVDDADHPGIREDSNGDLYYETLWP